MRNRILPFLLLAAAPLAIRAELPQDRWSLADLYATTADRNADAATVRAQ